MVYLNITKSITKSKYNEWLSSRLVGIFFVRSKETETPWRFADPYYPLISLNLRWHVFIVSFLHVEEKYYYIKKYHRCPWEEKKNVNFFNDTSSEYSPTFISNNLRDDETVKINESKNIVSELDSSE